MQTVYVINSRFDRASPIWRLGEQTRSLPTLSYGRVYCTNRNCTRNAHYNWNVVTE